MNEKEHKHKFDRLSELEAAKSILKGEVEEIKKFDAYKAGMLQVAQAIVESVLAKIELELHEYLQFPYKDKKDVYY